MDKMVKWRHNSDLELKKQELADMERRLETQHRDHSNELTGLKLQITAMHNQLSVCSSAAMKIKILRLCLGVAGTGLFISPGSSAVAAAVMAFVVAMFMVRI